MPKRKRLGEFDLVLIGAIYRGFTNGYAIRKQILRSRGSRWSGSTGAIYPALRRLEAARYLERIASAGDERRLRTSYKVTPKGKTALRRWLTDPIPEHEIGLISDPLRSRCFLLFMLTPAVRAKTVAQWIQANESYLSYFSKRAADVSTTSNVYAGLGFHNVVELLKGRRRWLKRLADAADRDAG
jgi:DNA-binding PadR family transcriptional regulator